MATSVDSQLADMMLASLYHEQAKETMAVLDTDLYGCKLVVAELIVVDGEHIAYG